MKLFEIVQFWLLLLPSSIRKKSENVYVSMHEGNPLYASTKELLMNTTETIVDTEVVMEGGSGFPHLLDGNPNSTEDKYAAIVE